MAITKLKAIKTNLPKALNYIKNPDKTDEKLLISGLACIPAIAHEQFQATKKYYDKTNRVLGYHLIQSFKPGEVTKEEAHRIGIELAERITGGKYEVVVATHINQKNYHNHIIFNSVSYVDGKKFINFKNSYKYVRQLSDEICKKYKLDIINTGGKGKSYKEWMEDRNGTSWKTMMKDDINTAINQSDSLEEFLVNIEKLGYEVGEGKHIKFRHKNYLKFVRGKTLGFDFTKEGIMARIDLKKIGFQIIDIGVNKKRYVKKKYVNYRRVYRPKNYLVFNINLGIKLIKAVLLQQENKNTPRPAYIKKYDGAIVNKLSGQIQYINKNNITSRQMLVGLIEKNEDEFDDIRDFIKSAEVKAKELISEIKLINIYEHSKNNLIDLLAKADINKPKVLNKLQQKHGNNPDFKSFIAAKEKLNARGINDEMDIQAKKNEYDEYIKRQELLKTRYKEIKKQTFELNELYNTVCKINNREYPFNYGVKKKLEEKRKEIDRSIER